MEERKLLLFLYGERCTLSYFISLSSSQISCSAFDKAFFKIQRPRTFSGNSGKASSASEAAPHKIAYAFLISCIEITSAHILSDYQIKCNI